MSDRLFANHVLWSLTIASVVTFGACSPTSEITGDSDSGTDAATSDRMPRDAGPRLVDAGPPPPSSTCLDIVCGAGQRCEQISGEASCQDFTCDELGCLATEICTPASDGFGGFVCQDNSCSNDAQCSESQYCDGSVCVPDACIAGTRTCDVQEVMECAPNGSETRHRFTCGGEAHFESSCTAEGDDAFCPCEDDWDCPNFTVCEARRCTGRGTAPTCLLEPQPLFETPPHLESGFPWGGEGRSLDDPALDDADGSPFSQSSQVMMPPMVANLDDDNEDGLIDERDIPEVIFLSFCDNQYRKDGVIRAVHGGGPNKGADYFARCGDTLWNEGDPLPASCACADAYYSTVAAAVGDLDYDGIPEIVVSRETNTIDGTHQIDILNNRGELITMSPATDLDGSHRSTDQTQLNPAPSIANLDGEGFAEIVVGLVAFTLSTGDDGDLVFEDTFMGYGWSGLNGAFYVGCVGNLVGDEDLEIVGGSTVYRMPEPPSGVTRRADCLGPYDDADHDAFCGGSLITVWDAQAVNGVNDIVIPSTEAEGFCAIADVLGTDQVAAPSLMNPLDGRPEVILVTPDRNLLQIFDGDTGERLRYYDVANGEKGGAPNVDDFDGDGFPEIGTAGAHEYSVIDLQTPTAQCPAWSSVLTDDQVAPGINPLRTAPPAVCTRDSDCGDLSQFACNERLGQCICLHNGWRRATEDPSSKRSGSSVFDFNGDGAAEVVYNDHCYLRIYEGLDGDVAFKEPIPNPTRIEYPVIADADNDGSAEILLSTSNLAGFCREYEPGEHNNGIEMWGDPSGSWMGARRIWNQYAYHVTNVTESGGIPVNEPEHWLEYNLRSYNTFRSQPREIGIAPDLAVTGMQFSSPDASCGLLTTMLNITVRIGNQGSSRAGGAPIGFYGQWTTGETLEEPLYADDSGTPLTAVLATLEPRSEVRITVPYDATTSTRGTLPDRIRVAVDDETHGSTVLECVEDNNGAFEPVSAGGMLADLTISLGEVSAVCPTPSAQLTVVNRGSADLANARVRFYAGNPDAGGSAFHEVTVTGPLAAGGGSVSVVVTLPPVPTTPFRLFAAVDPDNMVAECNDGNNVAYLTEQIDCPVF